MTEECNANTQYSRLYKNEYNKVSKTMCKLIMHILLMKITSEKDSIWCQFDLVCTYCTSWSAFCL